MESNLTIMDLHVHDGMHFLDSLDRIHPLKHCNTKPEDIVKTASKRGIDVIAVAGHGSISGGYMAKKIAKRNGYDVLVVPSEEVHTRQGHLLVLGANEVVPHGLGVEDAIDLIHSQGALAISVHPTTLFVGLGKRIVLNFKNKLDAIEVYNNRAWMFTKSAAFLAVNSQLPVTAGSDAHTLKEIGKGICATKETLTNISDLFKVIKKHKVFIPHYWVARWLK